MLVTMCCKNTCTPVLAIQAIGPKHYKITSCCAEYIQNILISDIKMPSETGFFAIIGDEATDSSNAEQLALILRYFSETNLEVKEVLLGFIECINGTTGQAVAELIIHTVVSLGFDMSLCRC